MAATLSENYVPTDFSDMFEHYYPYVVALVRRRGILPQSAEDVAMTILTKFFEKNALEDYRPEFTTAHDGIVRSARFPTFLSGFVLAYLRHYQHRQGVHLRRESMALEDAPLSFLWSQGTFEETEAQDFITSVTRHLQKIPPTPRSKVAMADLFEAIVRQVELTGDISVTELAQTFGVSATSVRNWLAVLREEIGEVIACE